MPWVNTDRQPQELRHLMPWVDPDCKMEPECMDIVCDRCGKREHYEAGADIQQIWERIFHARPKQDFLRQTFCGHCAAWMTPWIHQMRDIDELTMFVNKLKKAINERRNQNNRSTSSNAG